MQHMNTVTTLSIVCNSSDDTESFGERLGQQLKGNEVIELVSDLGGGKTTLVRGIARGAGSSDVVGSPTFMLSKVYQAPKCAIYHFDFYRLTEPGLMEHELHEALENKQAVVIVEWAEVVQHVLPDTRLRIELKRAAGESRELTCSYPKELAYLVGQA